MQTDINFTELKDVRVLTHDASTHSLVLLGQYGESSQPMILIIHKKPFPASYASNLDSSVRIEKYFMNDIFRRYTIELSSDQWNEIDVQTIYPASDKLISKYTRSPFVMITETIELYKSCVHPFIEAIKLTSLDWLYNILDGKAEQESILFRDNDPTNGFILIPDFKFTDVTQLETLHVSAIVQSRDLLSIRDLNSTHLPLLTSILSKGLEVIKDTYGVPSELIRVYFHYQPTYYHLHVHFTHVQKNDSSMSVDRAHAIQTVIHNITMQGDYYQRAPLFYTIQENHGIFKKIQESKSQELNLNN